MTRTAITTTTGTSAATAPLTLISAVSSATSAIVRTISRDRLSPADAISLCPAHAVTPVASSASLTTNSEAMKITVGIAEARERLLEVEHAGRPQRERDADRGDRRRHDARGERDDRRRQDQVGDGGVGHPSW